MRALILSDLHLEFWRGDSQAMLKRGAELMPDVVILAGDIHRGRAEIRIKNVHNTKSNKI